MKTLQEKIDAFRGIKFLEGDLYIALNKAIQELREEIRIAIRMAEISKDVRGIVAYEKVLALIGEKQ